MTKKIRRFFGLADYLGSIIYWTDRKKSIGPIFSLKNKEDTQHFR
ncbi:hypothetical protein [Enterococcus sp. BWB1-3]|nr:hypothetical protein [Enterococcus sp. BWB1-3]